MVAQRGIEQPCNKTIPIEAFLQYTSLSLHWTCTHDFIGRSHLDTRFYDFFVTTPIYLLKVGGNPAFKIFPSISLKRSKKRECYTFSIGNLIIRAQLYGDAMQKSIVDKLNNNIRWYMNALYSIAFSYLRHPYSWLVLCSFSR